MGLLSSGLSGQNYERYKALPDTSISSKYLGFTKNISVTVPLEWQKDLDRDFPLILVFDRQNQRSHNFILHTIDYLTSNEQMPSAVIISVESEQKYRGLETLHKASDAKGLAEENEKFLFEELIPLAEEQYKASPFRLFIGHSRYGYFTTSLLISRMNELNGVISLSPFFTQPNVDLTDSIKNIDKQEFTSCKYYRFGIGNDYLSDFSKMDPAIRQLHTSTFNAKGFLFKEAAHNVTPGLTIGVALYEIFEEWSKNQARYLANEQKELSIIDSLEKDIQSHYGSRLEFSIGTLNGKGWYFYNEGQFKKAIEAWELLLRSYPNFSEAYVYIIEAQIQLKENYAQTINRFEASLAKSNIYSDTEKDELRQELNTMKK
ncbi:MAG: alpha/beta hydrolase-fold protein [Flavobacteriales bacterium]